jgi:hypothetical protein
MQHPFETFSPAGLKVAFWASFAVTLSLILLLNLLGAPLITQAAPAGIVSLEFAGNSTRAQTIINSWDPGAKLHAAFILGLDYTFMLFYSTSIGLACVWMGIVLGARSLPFATIATLLAWGQWVAAGLDGLENVALTAILFGSGFSLWAPLALVCAFLKFGLILAGIAYALFGLGVYLGRRSISVARR